MREIRAAWSERGVAVYQAFKPEIADEALRLGTFGKGFGLERMTWIKPSFGWMLHRSEYATAHRQERILRLTLTHAGFREALGQAVLTRHEPGLYESESAWRSALKRTQVHCQWDPDRDLIGRPLERRAIQLGLSGEAVRRYVSVWIVGVEDATALAHAIRDAKRDDRPLPAVPEERPYPVEDAVRRRLGMPVV